MKDAIKQRKQALSKFCRYPTKENLNKVKIFRAKARPKASKRKLWKSYVSNLNHKTPIKKVWDMIQKISGKSKPPSFTHLSTKRGAKATSFFWIIPHLGIIQRSFKTSKNKKKRSNLISPLQIMKNIVCLT